MSIPASQPDITLQSLWSYALQVLCTLGLMLSLPWTIPAAQGSLKRWLFLVSPFLAGLVVSLFSPSLSRGPRRQPKAYLWMVLCLLALLCIPLLLSGRDLPQLRVWGSLLLLLSSPFFYFAFTMQCPACGRNWASRWLERKILKNTPPPYANAWINRAARMVQRARGSFERRTYRCRFCGHRWSVIRLVARKHY